MFLSGWNFVLPCILSPYCNNAGFLHNLLYSSSCVGVVRHHRLNGVQDNRNLFSTILEVWHQRPGNWHGQFWWKPDCFSVASCQLLTSLHGTNKRALFSSLAGNTKPTQKDSTLLISSQKSLFLIPLHWGQSSHIRIWGKSQHSAHCSSKGCCADRKGPLMSHKAGICKEYTSITVLSAQNPVCSPLTNPACSKEGEDAEGPLNSLSA